MNVYTLSVCIVTMVALYMVNAENQSDNIEKQIKNLKKQTTEKEIQKIPVKRSDLFGEFALAEYLFRRADVNKDNFLTKNEIYNFYRHNIKWPYQKAANMSIKLMKLGDINTDQKLDEIEAILALSKMRLLIFYNQLVDACVIIDGSSIPEIVNPVARTLVKA